MRCFNHRTIDSIGFCKECCKGLCEECAREGKGGLACKEGDCKRKVEATASYLDKIIHKPGIGWAPGVFIALTLIAMGCLFLVDFSSKTTLLAGMASLIAGLTLLVVQVRHMLEHWRKAREGDQEDFSKPSLSETFQSFQKVYEQKKKNKKKPELETPSEEEGV